MEPLARALAVEVLARPPVWPLQSLAVPDAQSYGDGLKEPNGAPQRFPLVSVVRFARFSGERNDDAPKLIERTGFL